MEGTTLFLKGELCYPFSISPEGYANLWGYNMLSKIMRYSVSFSDAQEEHMKTEKLASWTPWSVIYKGLIISCQEHISHGFSGHS